MSKALFVCVIAIVVDCQSLLSQPPRFTWVQRAGGTSGWDGASSVNVDPMGNVFSTGYFNSIATFGNFSLASLGSDDIFVAKSGPLGTFQWVRRIGGEATDVGYCVSSDSLGSVFVSGEERVFSTGTYYPTILLAKYSSSGVLQWKKNMGQGSGYGCSTDRLGNIIVTGTFSNCVGISDSVVCSFGFLDVFLAKFNSTGILSWVRGAGGDLRDAGVSVSTDNSGNVFVTGVFKGTAYFGPAILYSRGGYTSQDVFIAKYAPNGMLQWARSVGGFYDDDVAGIKVDSDGNFSIFGLFHGTAVFGTDTLVSVGDSDLFVAKYNQSGALIWVRQVRGTYVEYPGNITNYGTNQNLLVGWFAGDLTIGSITLNATASGDIFIVLLDMNGNVLWGRKAGGTGSEYARSIVESTGGSMVLGGGFRDTCVFDSFTLIDNTLWSDILLAKLDFATTVPEHARAIPNEYAISQNYPNPFNPETKIDFQIANTSDVTLKIYDLLGREVATLVNERMNPGTYSASWDASGFASGVYLYRMKAGEFVETRKLLLLR